MKTVDRRLLGEDVVSSDRVSDLQNAPRILEGGARRTWWEISAELQLRESNATGVHQRAMCGQAVRDTHDRAMQKLRDLLGQDFRMEA